MNTLSRVQRLPGALALAVFGVLALLLWINAAVNSYRFNVAIAVVATVPVLLVAGWGVAGWGEAGSRVAGRARPRG